MFILLMLKNPYLFYFIWIDLRTLLHQIAKVELDAIYAYFAK